MIIELQHKITKRQIVIETEVEDADSLTTMSFDGQHQEVLIYELSQSYGYYGHRVDIEQTTNLDLAAAVRKLPSFEVISIDPEPNPSGLPEGAVN